MLVVGGWNAEDPVLHTGDGLLQISGVGKVLARRSQVCARRHVRPGQRRHHCTRNVQLHAAQQRPSDTGRELLPQALAVAVEAEPARVEVEQAADAVALLEGVLLAFVDMADIAVAASPKKNIALSVPVQVDRIVTI